MNLRIGCTDLPSRGSGARRAPAAGAAAAPPPAPPPAAPAPKQPALARTSAKSVFEERSSSPNTFLICLRAKNVQPKLAFHGNY